MKGTIIITGANGSLGLSTVRNLLSAYPSHFAILTVRSDAASDPNTTKLRQIIAQHPSTQTSIEVLDLGSLQNVRDFAHRVSSRVTSHQIPPISAIVCNAFTWSLLTTSFSADGYENTFQVSHLGHSLLVLKLLESMDKENGRIVMLGSESHDIKNRNMLNSLGAKLPDDLEELVHPKKDVEGEEQKRGFRRYGNAKAANIMFMYSLNRKLLEDPKMRNITVTAMDPGGMPESRCFQQTPFVMRTVLRIVGYILPVAGYFSSAVRTIDVIAKDLVTMCLGDEMKGKRGYFLGLKEEESSIASRDEVAQKELWDAYVRWAGLRQQESVVRLD